MSKVNDPITEDKLTLYNLTDNADISETKLAFMQPVRGSLVTETNVKG